MSRIIKPGVFLAILGFCFAQPSPLPQNQASGEGYHIQVRRVIKHGAPGTAPLFEITFDYEFQNYSSVYVPGLGMVPAKGSFSYKVVEDRLEFMDGPKGRVIQSMTPAPTSAEMGVDSTDTPKPSDFSATARTDYWKPPLAGFPGAAADVIQKYFPFGYVVQAIGNTNFYITHYRTLQTSDVQLRSQIALMISQPYAISVDKLEYHIQIIARDRPRLSPTLRYGEDRSPLTLDAATKFVDKFIFDLKSTGGQK